jgi:hypothetical protein
MTRTALYRHFDAAGQLLYVGISKSAIARLAQHSDKPWLDDLATMKVEYFPTRGEAEAAEIAAIRTERPMHNRTFGSSKPSPNGLEPARSIIAKFGGSTRVAEICEVHRTRVANWKRPKEANGTAGTIPWPHVARLIAYAKSNGIDLDPMEFMPPSVRRAVPA